MSMRLLKEAIRIVDEDDNVKSIGAVRKGKGKPSKAERARQQLAAIATTSEYNPELDDIINLNMKRRNVTNLNKKKISKNMSLLEECRLRGKSDLLKRNIKYMIYETKCKLDPNKVKQITGYMDERNRRRKKILRALRRRNNGVQSHRWKSKKSSNKSIFTDEDFMKIGPDRIKLLQGKNVSKKQLHGKSAE